LDWYKKLDEERKRAYDEFLQWLGEVFSYMVKLITAINTPTERLLPRDIEYLQTLLDYLNNIRDFFGKQPGRPEFPKRLQALADLTRAAALYSELLKAVQDGRSADAERIRSEIAQVILAIGKL